MQVRDRLAGRDDLEIISIADEKRKDAGERKRLINEADCVILCTYRSSVCPMGAACVSTRGVTHTLSHNVSFVVHRSTR